MWEIYSRAWVPAKSTEQTAAKIAIRSVIFESAGDTAQAVVPSGCFYNNIEERCGNRIFTDYGGNKEHSTSLLPDNQTASNCIVKKVIGYSKCIRVNMAKFNSTTSVAYCDTLDDENASTSHILTHSIRNKKNICKSEGKS